MVHASSSFGSALRAANTPLVTGSLGGAAALVGWPALEQAISGHGGGGLPLAAIQCLNLAACALSLYAASQPGRLDEELVEDNGGGDADVAEFLSVRRGGTLVAPSNWAFAIWAPIFAGELLSAAVSLLLVRPETAVAGLLRQTSAAFCAAQVFQTLWAATFRRKYIMRRSIRKTNTNINANNIQLKFDALQSAVAPWLSAGMLTGIALCLNHAHAAYAGHYFVGSSDGAASLNRAYGASLAGDPLAGAGGVGTANYLLHCLPLSLHFAWATAAALVNWNGNLAVAVDNVYVLAAAGWASVVLATILGVAVTVRRSAPVYGGVTAWALAACAAGMAERLNERDSLVRTGPGRWFPSRPAKVDEVLHRKGHYGAGVQKWLCTVGAMIAGSIGILTALQPTYVAP